MPRYLQPGGLSEALSALARQPALAVLAGGTDFYPARVGRAVDEDVLDITRIAELRGIGESGGELRIGATTTWSELLEADLAPAFDGLKLAAREIGGRQIQNTGTIAGNLCNASPAADGTPALLALNARVELASARGVRTLALADFALGSRETARAVDELVTAIVVPAWPAGTRGSFIKLGARKYLVISIVMVSAVAALDARGVIARCGVAVGSCSAAPLRLAVLEARFTGMAADAACASIRAQDLDVLTPISDVRGSADYRLDVALTLVRQALMEACRR